MKILLTGATGYIGKRLLLELIYHGHQLVCTVRDKKRFYAPASILKKIEVIEVDFLDFKSLKKIPQDIESAYYLMHSMSNTHDYKKCHENCRENLCNKKTSRNATTLFSDVFRDVFRGVFRLCTLACG